MAIFGKSRVQKIKTLKTQTGLDQKFRVEKQD